ncbi:MAG: CPXCG motif-containing cysteine-rich protein [Gammaproteobacteria bacterium]|nr:CPXCG motif-containing cysteine-rich protein [Gammaproteobacteria bacterium]
MNTIETSEVTCPYCAESIEILIDCGTPEQDYIEDCPVCCRPIAFAVAISGNGKISVTAGREDD